MSGPPSPRDYTPEQIKAAESVYCNDCNAPPYRSCQRVCWDGDYQPYLVEREGPHSARIRKAIKFNTAPPTE